MKNSGDLNFRRLVMLEKGARFQSELESASYEVQVLVFCHSKDSLSILCFLSRTFEVRPCVQQRACSPTGGNYNIIRFR